MGPSPRPRVFVTEFEDRRAARLIRDAPSHRAFQLDNMILLPSAIQPRHAAEQRRPPALLAPPSLAHPGHPQASTLTTHPLAPPSRPLALAP